MHRLDRLFKNSITDYIIIALGASVYGASVAVFTSKNNIAPGGELPQCSTSFSVCR